VIDTTNSSPYSREDILLNHWLWLSTQERYTAFISVMNPASGERIPLTVKEAYTFLWYAFTKSIGIDLDFVPQVLAKRVQRLPEVRTNKSLSAAGVTDPAGAGTPEDLMSIVDNAMISFETAQLALSMQPKIDTIISTEAFYEICDQVYQAAQMQRNLVASQEHAVKRGMVHAMISRIYSDSVCNLEPPGTTYDSWFAERNIDVGALSRDDMGVLYQDLVREATGAGLNNNSSLKDLQAAMVKMLSQLSSYSVQIIAEINNSEIKKTDWTAIRVGDINSKGHMLRSAPDMSINPQSVSTNIRQRESFVLNGATLQEVIHEKVKANKTLEIHVKPEWNKDSATRFYIRHPISRLMAKSHTPLPTNDRDIVPVMGLDLYLALPAQQQQQFYDVYNGGYSPLPTEDVDPIVVDTGYVKPRYVAPNFSF
jgi:hypothetical protein